MYPITTPSGKEIKNRSWEEYCKDRDKAWNQRNRKYEEYEEYTNDINSLSSDNCPSISNNGVSSLFNMGI